MQEEPPAFNEGIGYYNGARRCPFHRGCSKRSEKTVGSRMHLALFKLKSLPSKQAKVGFGFWIQVSAVSLKSWDFLSLQRLS